MKTEVKKGLNGWEFKIIQKTGKTREEDGRELISVIRGGKEHTTSCAMWLASDGSMSCELFGGDYRQTLKLAPVKRATEKTITALMGEAKTHAAEELQKTLSNYGY